MKKIIIIACIIITGLANNSLKAETFLSRDEVDTAPYFEGFTDRLVYFYPPIARRAGIEGRVIVDLLVDFTGTVTRVTILREEPEGWHFGEAALHVFTGLQGIPATVNGEPVSCILRVPVDFRIRR